jgi:hypothetical protein
MATEYDDFNRAAGAIGSGWTQAAGESANPLVVGSNSGCNATGSGGAYRNSFTIAVAGTMYCQVTEIGTPTDPGIGLFLEDSGGNGYKFKRNSNGIAQLLRNGSATGMPSWNPGSYTAGTLKLEKIGADVRMYYNGSQVGTTYTDGTPFNVTRGGLWTSYVENTPATYRVDNFEVGDGGAAASILPIIHHFNARLKT